MSDTRLGFCLAIPLAAVNFKIITDDLAAAHLSRGNSLLQTNTMIINLSEYVYSHHYVRSYIIVSNFNITFQALSFTKHSRLSNW